VPEGHHHRYTYASSECLFVSTLFFRSILLSPASVQLSRSQDFNRQLSIRSFIRGYGGRTRGKSGPCLEDRLQPYKNCKNCLVCNKFYPTCSWFLFRSPWSTPTMNSSNQELRQTYEEIFEELPPFESLLWDEPLDTRQPFASMAADPRSLNDYPEGYPVGNASTAAATTTPALDHSASSSNKRPKPDTSAEDTYKRQLRRHKQRSVELTFAVRAQTNTNPHTIAAHSVDSILRPYGNIRDVDLLAMWSRPNEQNFACQLTAVLEGHSTSNALLLPKYNVNLLPTAIANDIHPIGRPPPTATYRLDSVVCRVGPQLSLKTTIGKVEAQVVYYVTDDVQVVVLGSGAMSSMTLHWDPRLLRVTSSQNDLIQCSRIPLRSSNDP